MQIMLPSEVLNIAKPPSAWPHDTKSCALSSAAARDLFTRM